MKRDKFFITKERFWTSTSNLTGIFRKLLRMANLRFNRMLLQVHEFPTDPNSSEGPDRFLGLPSTHLISTGCSFSPQFSAEIKTVWKYSLPSFLHCVYSDEFTLPPSFVTKFIIFRHLHSNPSSE